MILSYVFLCLKQIYNIALDIIAPPICFSCKKHIMHRAVLCDNCDGLITPIAPKLFRVNSLYTMSVHAICKYDDNPVKKLILAKHYSDYTMLQGLSDLMITKTIISDLPVDYIIPIPLHWTRKLKRGFNQAELFAHEISKYKQIPVLKALSRVKKTKYQARLEKQERKNNLSQAFVLQNDVSIVKGKHVLLVDDLCTTGATLVEAAKLLSALKPASITTIVAARAL